MQPYDDQFYAEGSAEALRSARRIVPEVLRLVPARSVLDVGCGLGTWLSVFAEHGVQDVTGVDGGHVNRSALRIPSACFHAADLAAPLALERTYELALSLEVAEHLPADAADRFVADLCRAAPVVMFSAAVPSQGGVLHVNEQWPEYWARRFAARGYWCADPFRDALWDAPEVSWWYAQNLLFYVAPDVLPRYPELAALTAPQPPRNLAHPRLVERNAHRKCLLETLLDLLSGAPPGARLLVAGGEQLPEHGRGLARFTWVPFLERNGKPWGAPVDSDQAIAELERMRGDGATALAIVWPSLWWLEKYPGFAAHIRRHYVQLPGTERVQLWDLAAR